MDDQNAIAEFVRLAEAEYTAMYDARPSRAKDHYDDARHYFHQAIEAARRAGRATEVTHLARRVEHIEMVYNTQFRGVGR